jgi:hypothetical protein
MTTLPDKHKNYRNSIKKQILFTYNAKGKDFRCKKMLVISKKKLNDYRSNTVFHFKKKRCVILHAFSI